MARHYAIGIDIGGTFTDFILIDQDGKIETMKVSSTPSDPASGVISGLKKLSDGLRISGDELLAGTRRFVHGTTIATNALLERKGARVALITTRGFRDNLNIRRMWRENTFDLRSIPPVPLVDRDQIHEVDERIDRSGRIVKPLDEKNLLRIVGRLKKDKIESIAVCLLFSFLNPVHERRIKEIISRELPDINISLSADICPEIREYERCSTTVINSFLSHAVGGYFKEFEAGLAQKGLKTGIQIMQSNGGVTTSDFVEDRPVNIFLSGPAGGVVASAALGERSKGDRGNFITVDMGGTSFDICLLNKGKFALSTTNIIHGWHINVPMIDMHTIGAGGGSVAWLDIAQGLHVGPQSAGAFPGPACYMRGGKQPTVTDADLVLGYLSPEYFLGGDMQISLPLAEKALGRISRPLKMSSVETADGIFQIVNNNMANGIRVVTVEKGFDPRDFKLIVFGGAGAVHVPAFARDLGIRHIIVPKDASVFSALGLVLSDMRYHFVKNVNQGVEEISSGEINRVFDDLRRQGQKLLGSWGAEKKDIHFELLCDMKFPGQYRELTVNLPAEVSSAQKIGEIFKQVHDQLYGFVEDQAPRIINARVNAVGRIQRSKIIKSKPAGPGSRQAVKAKRDVFFHEKGGHVTTLVYDGQKINPGNRLKGPAVIELPTTTIVVRPDQSVYMDAYFNFNILA